MYLSFILATIKIYCVAARISATDGQQTLSLEYFSAGLKLLRGEPCINLSLVYSRSRKNKLASDIASASAFEYGQWN
jgi:hypothetical protein